MPSLLLVEDDPSLGTTLCSRLRKESYTVHYASSFDHAKRLLESETIDIALIDIGLGDGDGFSLVREMKQDIPFLFLTAMNSAEYRLEGYELGADDYIPKPFHLKELLLRLEQVLNKHNIGKNIDCGCFLLNVDAQQIEFKDGKKTQLSTRDFKLLKALIQRAPKVLRREEVLNKLWSDGGEGGDERGSSRSIDNAILRLRNVLEHTGEDRIRSIRGLGYHWDSATMPE